MNQTLLQTKLFIPPLRAELVGRPRLMEQLNQGLQPGHKLTLISAPAGFGKTTLASEWIAGCGRPAAWLSLDEGDNDLSRFLAYLVTALQTIAPGLGEGVLAALQSPQPPPLESLLTLLLNEIGSLPENCTLVLDDYHVIEAQPVDFALTFLLDNLPPQLHLLIATRVDPNLPLARLRARSQLTELRAEDLRFASAEAAEFLNQMMNLNLSGEDIDALEDRTEGWIAGLQLAAISMQGRGEAAERIKSFTGSHRFVLDYLIEEVVAQQPEHIQSFLTHTAVLERMTGSLCGALTGQDNSQATLEMLERANLFIVSLDGERRWYRYHHLFADLLQQRLRQTQPELLPILLYRASEWYEENGFPDEAIEYALRASDFERAAQLIQIASDAMWQRGAHGKLRRWLLSLPEKPLCARPHLCVYHAWYQFAGGQQEAAERTVRAAELALQPGESDKSAEETLLRGRVAAIRTFMDSYRGNVPGIIHHARQALAYLPTQDSVWRRMTAIVLGDAQGFRGDMKAAYEARYEALQLCQAAGDVYYTLLASMKVAITLRELGHLRQTIEICRKQLQLANEHGLSKTSLAGLLMLVEAEVLAELDDLDGAKDQAFRGIELAERAADLTILGWGYMCMIRILFSIGDAVSITEYINKLENIDRESDVPSWIMQQASAWEARLRLEEGNAAGAAEWANGRDLDLAGEPYSLRDIDYFSLSEYVLLARILMAQAHEQEAVILLQDLFKEAEAGARTAKAIEILILQALAFQTLGARNKAIDTLEQALALAEPEGFVRIFIDEGAPVALLLQEAAVRRIAPDYVRRLLSSFSPAAPPEVTLSGTHPATGNTQAAIIDPLSERELEVLQLIANGLTNQEIASRLFLSLNTVKVHTRNIYGKLDVHTRTQAVAQARTLGILPPV